MPDSIGQVYLDLQTNYAPFQQQLNNISGKSTNMVSSAFGKLGKVIGGAFAVTKLVQFGKASINLASDLQEVQNVVDVVFGESASQINNFAKTAITQYGLSELSAKRYSSTMGAMLKSMGLSDDAVLGMSQSITALTGDMASFYNLDSDTAFQKIRAGISGETEPLKQLGINMSQANLEAFALSQGITKSYQSMTQSEQALLRYNYLLSTTADAQGDFARTSDSWANQTRILQEQLNGIKASLGSAFIALLTPLLKLMNQFIGKLQIAAEYFKAFVEAITGVKTDSDSTASSLGGITEEAEGAAEAATKASKALAGFDKLNVLSSSGGDAGGSSSAGSSLDFNIPTLEGTEIPAPDMSGVETVITSVKGMFAGLKDYITDSFAPTIESWGQAFANLKEPIKDSFNSVWESVQGVWNNTLVPFGEYLTGTWVPAIVNSFSETLAPVFSDLMSVSISEFATDFEFICTQIDAFVKDILQPAFNTVQTVFTDAAQIIATEWETNGEKLIGMFLKVRDSVKEIWTNLYEGILKPVWNLIVGAIDSLWENHLKSLWESIVSFTSKLGESIMTIWNNFLAPLVNWIIKTFGPNIVSQVNVILNAAKTVIGNLIDAVKNIFTALGGLLDFVTGVFSGDWKKAWTGIKTFFKGIWDALVDIVKSPINLILGCINAMLNGITLGINHAISSLNKLRFDVPDWVPVIGGKTWGFNIAKITAPQIPYLARGGIIDQPTLAMVGEAGKEAVVPLENTAFADSIANAIMRVLMPLFTSGKVGGQTKDEGNTVIILKVGEYELGRVTVGAINKYHNVIGKVELEV